MPPPPPQFTPGKGPGSNPKLGGPLQIYEGFHAGDSGPTAEWVAAAISRPFDWYRGSYSLNANAANAVIIPDTWSSVAVARSRANYLAPGSILGNSADQAGPGLEYAPTTQSRSQAFFRSPLALTTTPLSGAALDAWAQTTFGRATPYYAGERPITISVWDPAAGSFADWTPAALLSRSVDPYAPPASQASTVAGLSIITDAYASAFASRISPLFRSPAAFLVIAYDQPASGADFVAPVLSRVVDAYQGSWSRFIGASDQAPPDDWASVYASRPVYSAALRSRSTNVYDPATNSFADWSPTVLLSRAVEAYSPPAAQPQVAWGQSIVTDAWAPFFAQPGSPLYRSARSLIISVFDPALNTFADWTPQALASRSSALYRSPAPFLARVFDQPAVISSTDWASVAQGFRAPFRYLGQQSVTVAVYDPATNTFADWATAALASRSVQDYAPPRSQALTVAGLSIVTDAFAEIVTSRGSPLFRSPASFLALAYDQPVIIGTDYAQPATSRSVPYYRAPASLSRPAYDQPVVVFGTEFAPMAITMRPSWPLKRSASRTILSLDLVVAIAGAQIGLYAYLIAAGIPSALLNDYLDRVAILIGGQDAAMLTENDPRARLIVIEGPEGSVS